MKYDMFFEGGGAKGMVFVGTIQDYFAYEQSAAPMTYSFGVAAKPAYQVTASAD